MIRVLLVDDHPMLRAGVRRSLETDPGIEVVAEAASVTEALRFARSVSPDVVVLDVDLNDGDRSGADVAQALKGSSARILAFSAHDGRGFIRAMLDAGAAGYITKDTPEQELIAAVKAVASGQGRWHVVPNDPMHPIGSLTERERDMLRLLAKGLSNADIADTLFVSESTVRNTLTGVYEKVGATSSREAMAWAWENGIGPHAP
ncbi:response regulator [Rubricoccus marinus]|uniref:DNA-binding response regulator n=1 Tax=Rubricoccus marinus TaxID=716817 RepID=A0A259TUP1_9BACT|nr:response regulator transcription factor [Rubricoccus marinus]OZC01451.1 hypothetical protein BSZ36_17390 [Rubricoccus marinus]